MLDSYGLVLSLLWLLALAGIIFFTRWLHRWLATTELTADVQVLILISLVGLLALSALSYLWKLGANHTTPTTAIPAASNSNVATVNANAIDNDLDSFEQATYPQLYGLRQQMLDQLSQLDQFFHVIQDVARQKPEQRFFLQKIIDIRWERRKALRLAYTEIDRSRREFWLHYQSGQNTYVRQMFNTEADHLQKKIQDALGESLIQAQAETDLINNYLHFLGDALHKPQTKASKSKAKTQAIPPKLPQFVPYAGVYYQAVMQWLQQHQATVVIQNIERLRQEEQIMRDKIAYILQYQQLNQDLTSEIKDLVNNWNEALIFNQYSQYRLLRAAEALDTIGILVLEADRRDIEWLQGQLQLMAPQIVQQAEEEKMVAAYSYNPEVDHKYRSNPTNTTTNKR